MVPTALISLRLHKDTEDTDIDSVTKNFGRFMIY